MKALTSLRKIIQENQKKENWNSQGVEDESREVHNLRICIKNISYSARETIKEQIFLQKVWSISDYLLWELRNKPKQI